MEIITKKSTVPKFENMEYNVYKVRDKEFTKIEDAVDYEKYLSLIIKTINFDENEFNNKNKKIEIVKINNLEDVQLVLKVNKEYDLLIENKFPQILCVEYGNYSPRVKSAYDYIAMIEKSNFLLDLMQKEF